MPYLKRKSYARRARSSVARTRKGRRSSRGYSRRKGYSKVSRKWPIWKNPLPQQSKFKLTYADSRFNLATAVGGGYISYRAWRGNSLFDPDFTGVGVQPYGYDQLCGAGQPFGKYIVYGSKITVYPHVYSATSGTAGNYTLRYALVPMAAPSLTYTEFEDISRIPNCKRRVIESANDTKNILSCYSSTRRVLPDAGDLSGGTYSALYNASPTAEWYWVLHVDSNEFQNDTSTYFDCKITYYCKLMKIDDVNES